MTATITDSKNIGANGWKLNWVSNLASPTFYIYQDGILANVTQQTSGIFTVEPNASLVVEVFDNPTEQPAHALPGKISLFWYAVPDADHYRIEEDINSTWVERYNQPANGLWYYSWKSRYLEDCQWHQFRIIPVGTNGADGTAILASGYIIRYPDIPSPSYSYNPTTQSLTLI